MTVVSVRTNLDGQNCINKQDLIVENELPTSRGFIKNFQVFKVFRLKNIIIRLGNSTHFHRSDYCSTFAHQNVLCTLVKLQRDIHLGALLVLLIVLFFVSAFILLNN